MVLTYLVYLLIALIILIGMRFTGFKTNFHDNPMELNVAKALRGLAAIGVIIHHISQEEMMKQAHELSAFVNAGYLFVAIFLFSSGYGLIKNYLEKPGYLNGFLKKRLPVIIVPYYVSAIIYFAFRYLIIREKMAPMQIVTGVLGLSMMNEYAWYPIVLAILYISFYLLFTRIKKPKTGIIYMFLVVLLLGAIFSVNGHFAWWAHKGDWWLKGNTTVKWWMKEKVFWLSGEWWVNSAIAFVMGMIVAYHETSIYTWLKKAYWIKLAAAVVLYEAAKTLAGFTQMIFGYWSEYGGNGPHILDKFLSFIFQMPEIITWVLLIYIVLMKVHTINGVTKFMGNISLETYLMNLIAIISFRFVLYMTPIAGVFTVNVIIYFVAVFALTIILAITYKYVCDRLIRMLKKDK